MSREMLLLVLYKRNSEIRSVPYNKVRQHSDSDVLRASVVEPQAFLSRHFTLMPHLTAHNALRRCYRCYCTRKNIMQTFCIHFVKLLPSIAK